MSERDGAADARRVRRNPKRPVRDKNGLYRAEVTRIVDLSPRLRRISIAAPELATFRPLGPDEYVGLLLPTSESTQLTLPDDPSVGRIRACIAEMPEEVRPDLRWYTVRSHRPDDAEIDVDFVVHGDEGPGSRFAGRARPGSVLGVREGGALYAPDADGAQLLIGDETSLPAIAAIIESTAGSRTTRALIEVPHDSDRIALPVGADATWIVREHSRPGAELLAALRETSLPNDLAYAWVCGEQETSTTVRRHLAQERGVDKAAITFSGYWRLGHARL